MNGFARMLEAETPRLRRYARALARGDLARADDLVQSCLTRAVAKQHLWELGSDLRAWLFTILHNQYVNDVRRSAREGAKVAIEEVAPVLTVPSNAMAALELRDLEIAIGKLPHEQRQAILLVGLEGMSYEEVASILQIPVGTVRSRISRGRDQLRRLMGMEEECYRKNPQRAHPRATKKRTGAPLECIAAVSRSLSNAREIGAIRPVPRRPAVRMAGASKGGLPRPRSLYEVPTLP